MTDLVSLLFIAMIPIDFKIILTLVIYMSDIPSVVAHSKVFLFADNTKCFKHIKVPRDTQLLQQDLIYLSNWSKTTLLWFHPSKKALTCPLIAKLQLLITSTTVL